MPRVQGIYAITNVLTGQMYVGSSADVHRRWADHKRELRANVHKNALLQAEWIKHGMGAFTLSVIEGVPTLEELVAREQHYLDILQPAYNEVLTAVRSPFRTWRSDAADEIRFWSKVERADGCWL